MEQSYRQEKEQIKLINNLYDSQRKKEAEFIQAKIPFNQREIPFTENDVLRLGGSLLETRDNAYSVNAIETVEDSEDY